MSQQRNVFDKVRDDAIRAARADNPRLSSSGRNSPGASSGFGEVMTRPDADFNTIGPFIVDVSPVDDPHFTIL